MAWRLGVTETLPQLVLHKSMDWHIAWDRTGVEVA